MKIRHLLLVAIMALTTVATAVAQAPLSFTYQAVVRNSSGRLVSNATVGVKISIVRDSATGRVVYSGVQTPRTNANGLFTLVIGDSQNGIDTITWRNGPYFLKSEVDPNGGTNYTLTSVQQMLSVPYALHAHTVDSIIGGVNFIERQVLSMNGDTVFLTGGSYVVLPPSFSGNYNDLTNKPTIPTVPTNVSAFTNDAGYLTSSTLIETQVLSIRHDTVFLTGGSFVKLPAGFSGNYNDLTNKPTIPTVPTNVSAFTNDAGYLTSATLTETQVLSMRHDTVFLTGGSFVKLPAGFSGNYNDLTNKPTIPTVPTNVSAFTNDAGYLTNATLTETQVLSIRHDTVFLTGGSFVKLPAGFSGNYNDLTNKPVLFSGVYDSLTNKPTNVSSFTNDAGYLTSYTETQVLSKRGDTVFLTGGSFVVLPSETQNLSDVATNNDSVNSQIKNLYDPTDSMDAVNLRTLNNVIGRYDSIINNLLNTIDTQQTTVAPSVVTVSISNVTSTTATVNGNVTSNGGANVTARGVCWDTLHNPTISGSHTTNGTGVGNYTSSITGLTAGTTYYVRAYATNSAGTAYGSELSFNSIAVLPTVTTTAANNITDSTATSGGNVTSDGGAAVSARGVCWSTSHNPTISDSHTSNGAGIGSFTSSMTGLVGGITYYVRAYATNSVGTAYGSEISFNSIADLPTVITTVPSNVTGTTAVSGGNVTNDGGAIIISSRGICWSTSHNPTISDSHTSNGTGLGSFTSSITGLTTNTTYFVRAYATNLVGTAYGNEVTFTTSPSGILSSTFTVGNNRRVHFSQGNLQYTTTGTHAVAGGRTLNGTWRFAEHQWDTIGAANSNASSSYTGWIDLFGWGTNAYPYGTSTTPTDYGPSATDIAGTNYDWGVYNAISNGGNQPGLWRTLTAAEWDTLINRRTTASGIRYAKATVNGVPGLIIVPDNWSVSTYILNDTNKANASLGANIIPSALWNILENAGCVFLPAAGQRSGSTVSNVGSWGEYWSASRCNRNITRPEYYAMILGFHNNMFVYTQRNYGLSVRLVQDVAIAKPTVTTTTASNINDTSAVSGGNVTNDGGAAVTARGVCWSTSRNPTISDSHTSDSAGTGSFTSYITGLTANTTYYARAYATNSVGTAYGNEVIIIHGGVLPGLFSVDTNRKVHFSQGNLQYSNAGTHTVRGGGTARGTWRFAPHQWDTIGAANSNISSTYIICCWIDLFGWATSGYIYDPYMSSTSNGDYGGSGDITGSNSDWGVYNAISNGGNRPGQWRTLTRAEWDYLLGSRTTVSGVRYAKAIVNGVAGLIIVPDNWSASTYALNRTNTGSYNFDANIITFSQWSTLENAGCVFLPAAGSRSGSSVGNVNSYGGYWLPHMSFSYNDFYAYSLYFNSSTMNISYGGRSAGFSVRLVQDVTGN